MQERLPLLLLCVRADAVPTRASREPFVTELVLMLRFFFFFTKLINFILNINIDSKSRVQHFVRIPRFN